MKIIKFIKKDGRRRYGKQIPGDNTYVWGECQFTFDSTERNYDWLVAVDNLPTESLACSPEQTIFVATEPSSISYYGNSFVAQFGYLITNQDEKSLPHPNALRTQPGNHWFYEKTYDEISREKPPQKTKLLSAIATHKCENHTLHKLRFDFIRNISKCLPEADILYSRKELSNTFSDLFGDRLKYVPGKYAMIDDYKYHLAIGNEEGPNILTERVSDSFLGYAVPISFGCTNLADYFPEDSYVEIDIRQPEKAIEKINRIIHDENDYERRLDSIIEARRRVMDEYNLMSMIRNIVENHHPGKVNFKRNKKIYSRRIRRTMSLSDLLGFFLFRLKNIFKDFSFFW